MGFVIQRLMKLFKELALLRLSDSLAFQRKLGTANLPEHRREPASRPWLEPETACQSECHPESST
jgi:hypothetical protein